MDDYIKPFYVQLFQPLPNSEILPLGWNAGEMVERLMAADKSITVDQATSFASTRIDTTFKNIGDNADTTTIMTDNFTVATRSRGNIVYGPHMTAQRVKPSGGN